MKEEIVEILNEYWISFLKEDSTEKLISELRNFKEIYFRISRSF